MESEQPLYLHVPVEGLPQSLLEREGKTVAAIAFMQHVAGLNRETRRGIDAVSLEPGWDDSLDGLSKAEANVLTHYLSAKRRAATFWNALKRPRESRYSPGGAGYALTIDLQLLSAYVPGWGNLDLDEAALSQSCPEWLRIRTRIQGPVRRIVDPAAFGVFMLWPRLIEDLEDWERHDDNKRIRIGRAVFSLSSVGRTDWFIREALKRQPQLEPELGRLVKLTKPAAPTNEPESSPTVIPDSDWTTESISEPGGNALVDWQGRWDTLLTSLDQLRVGLHDSPVVELVNELGELVDEMRSVLESRPADPSIATAQFEAAVSTLLAQSRHLGEAVAFEWLTEDILVQVQARWGAASAPLMAGGELVDLTADALRATERLARAADAYRAALEAKVAAEALVEESRLEVGATQAMVDRRLAERRKRERQQALFNAEAALPTLEDGLLAAVSPYENPFDHAADYRLGPLSSEDIAAPTKTKSAVQIGEELVRQSPAAPEPSVTATLAENPAAATELEVSSSVLAATPATASESANATELVEPVTPRVRDEPAAIEIAISVTPVVNVYSKAAGEQCRPVWKLLKQGRLSLAYQLSTALSAEDPALKVPPPALLSSVALSSRLVWPDGGVRDALASSLADLSSDTFEQNGSPADWYVSMNLLLVAATLRAMILVPGVGASSIAGYLHLDAKYRHLYSLVQTVRDVSERLQAFRIEPATLKMAHADANLPEEQKALSQAAHDWVTSQAPAMTIKFAAATSVWRHWVKPQGVISQLVSPVASNRLADLQTVKELIASMSDPSEFQRRVRETDRTELKRKKGEDIHSGALDHLERCTAEAVSFSRRWVSLAEAEGQSADRLRTLLKDVRSSLADAMPEIRVELTNANDSAWGLIPAARSVVRSELDAILNLFDPKADLPHAEPTAAEALMRETLLVPELRLLERWTLRNKPEATVSAVTAWAASPCDWNQAFRARLDAGDLLGAELIVEDYPDSETAEQWSVELKRERETWRSSLRRAIDEARQAVEVGRAYGYLTDSELGILWADLTLRDAQCDETGQFDVALEAVRGVRIEVDQHRKERTDEVRRSMRELPATKEVASGVVEVEEVLEKGDIATANELLQRIRNGQAAWPAEHRAPDRFNVFFPKGAEALAEWLETQPSRGIVESSLKGGQNVAALDFRNVGTTQREQAARLYGMWSDLKSRKRGEAAVLESLFVGLGMGFRRIQMTDRQGNREVWDLDVAEIEERDICPIPQFGSGARGHYRIICLWGGPSEEEIVQLVGDPSMQRATIVLYFDRMTERRWRETSRQAKASRRSFLLLDEIMLVYLMAQEGSKLSGLFELALPFAYSMPYDATAGLVPPEMFYGRSMELEAIRELNGRCFIYGGRQLGKTALLRRAEQSFHSPKLGRYSRWIDLRAEGIGVSRTAADIWVCLTEQLKKVQVLDAAFATPTPSKKGSVDSVMNAIRQFLGDDSNRRVLLLLDEADSFFEQDGRSDFAETRRLKQLMDDTGRQFKVVFAGLHNVLRMTELANHPLAHFGEPIKVGPLVDEHEIGEAEDLVRRPLAAAGFEFESRNLVIRVLAQTNYYPSLIQLYCSHLLRHMLTKMGGTRRSVGPRYPITDKDIETVYASGALRSEIRSKFRLTLQLDPRYEVVAYALALDAIRGRYAPTEGMDWQGIRETGANYWWPEGFRDTSELDFKVLLDEMVELGVLSRSQSGRYALRNPNVLLLLGSQEEIEAVLVKEREPAIEFEAALFRPPLKSSPASPRRNPFTYQQLSELMRRDNPITVVAGNAGSGIFDVVEGLRDYLGTTAPLVVLDDCNDKPSFSRSLDRALKARETDGISVMVVPSTVPWSAVWVKDARQKLDALRSATKFVSLIFLADPMTLWSAIEDEATFTEIKVPWMSLLPWSDNFVSHWLTELHLQGEPETRKQLHGVTGYWPTALQTIALRCTEDGELKKRILAAQAAALEPVGAEQWAETLGLKSHLPRMVLQALASWGDPAMAEELEKLTEAPKDEIKRVLRWADLLSLVQRGGGDYWSVDPFLSAILQKLEE